MKLELCPGAVHTRLAQLQPVTGGAILVLLFLIFCPLLTAQASESNAVIVAGISGEDSEKISSLAKETKRLLVKRGFAPQKVQIVDQNVTRDLVLQKLQGIQSTTNDEFWLVLYGVSGRTRGNQPAFQVKGPRLTAEDLKRALDSIPGRQFVFIGTGNAGGFLPILQDNRRSILSATQEDGEPDRPRFPELWLEALEENPTAPFNELAARASVAVEAVYTKKHLAQSEHARLADPVSGGILEAPFGVKPAQASNKSQGDSKMKQGL